MRATPYYPLRPSRPSPRSRRYYAVCCLLPWDQGCLRSSQPIAVARHVPRHLRGLPRYAVIPSVQRRRMYKARPNCGWRAVRSRARSPRLDHTSYQARVPRPARSFHAAFRCPLARTPVRFPCPAAPRLSGQETCTPKHDSMHGTHASGERRATSRGHPHIERACRVARPLQCVVLRPFIPLRSTAHAEVRPPTTARQAYGVPQKNRILEPSQVRSSRGLVCRLGQSTWAIVIHALQRPQPMLALSAQEPPERCTAAFPYLAGGMA